MSNLADFGARLAQVRKARGISQEKLAQTVKLASGTISKYEGGKLEPGLTQLTPIADAVDVSLDWLIAGRGAPPRVLRRRVAA